MYAYNTAACSCGPLKYNILIWSKIGRPLNIFFINRQEMLLSGTKLSSLNSIFRPDVGFFISVWGNTAVQDTKILDKGLVACP